MTPQRYAACGHVVASRRGALTGPVDNALQELGLERKVIAVVPGFLDALTIARQSDLIALVPRSCLRDGEVAAQGLEGFGLPVSTPELAISVMWHPASMQTWPTDGFGRNSPRSVRRCPDASQTQAAISTRAWASSSGKAETI
jgi:DNA-binding transcriptional LysR family regulator